MDIHLPSKCGLSFSLLGDIIIPPEKHEMIKEANKKRKPFGIIMNYKHGYVDCKERYNHGLDIFGVNQYVIQLSGRQLFT
ncbi:MAG: hypothetical protein CM15mP62_10340 [Rhodospirillaceae bacterium]|nr:MAG: hypothetical protein CM15mP62_10340 [Rhodospirillaceae bacterium]